MNIKIVKSLLLILVCSIASSCIKMDISVQKMRAKYGNGVSGYLPIGGMNVHYREEGHEKAFPVLLIHGMGASLHTWDDWAAELKEEFFVLRVDLPGFGLTGPQPKGDYSMIMYRDFIRDFLDAVDVKACHIVGNGMGGRVAWEVALTYPDLVKKVILMDSEGYPLTEEEKQFLPVEVATSSKVKQSAAKVFTSESLVRKSLLQAYGDDTKLKDETVTRYYEMLLREGNRRAYLDRANHEDYDRSARIKKIEAPTLIMWGTEDVVAPIRHASLFHRDLPNSMIKLYPGVGHLPMEENPEESVRDALEFLRYKKKK